MANGENDGFDAVVVVESDVGPLAKFDDPFAEFRRQVFDCPPDFRVGCKGTHAFTYGRNRTPGGLGTLREEKGVKPSDISQGLLRPP